MMRRAREPRLSPRRAKTRLCSHCAPGIATPRLARGLHSLVRVSRRDGWGRREASDLSADRDRNDPDSGDPTGTARSPGRPPRPEKSVRPWGLRCLGEGRRYPQSGPPRGKAGRDAPKERTSSARCLLRRTELSLTGPGGNAAERDDQPAGERSVTDPIHQR